MALNNIGGKCINFSEINKEAINAYCDNFNVEGEANLGDITQIKKLPRANLLTAGVPCQSWSIAGRNLGFDDDRGQLWNDTIYLLNQSRPDAFIFENVKGLVDPRNRHALTFILDRIKEAGYHAKHYVLNSFQYGVPQNRIRIYIIGFKEKKYFERFVLPEPIPDKIHLSDILEDFDGKNISKKRNIQKDLFGGVVNQRSMSLSNNNGFNDYFLFNDLRNGHSTVHSWDIIETTERQKEICYLLLKNRRKSKFGHLDGNPLSLKHFKELDAKISENDIFGLVKLEILKEEQYEFAINAPLPNELTTEERTILDLGENGQLVVDLLKSNRKLKMQKISISNTIKSLLEKNVITCTEVRYDFRNTKISTGLFGINRIFLPNSNIFPTLVASDTNDYVSSIEIVAKNENEYKREFIEKIYKQKNYRRITKEEACLIQGFPMDYKLPKTRVKWMKLIGNSVSVPVVQILGKAIYETGVFRNK